MRAKQKKGIMTSSLLTILFAIIIFVFLTLMLSKCLRLSDQAEESFKQFGKLVEKVQAMPEGGEEGMVLIMDAGTALVGFNQDSTKVESCGVVGYPSRVERCYTWPHPEAECLTGGCLCLIRDINRLPEEELVYSSFFCEKIEGAIFTTPQYISRLEGVPGEDIYFNRGGFVLGRDLNFNYLVLDKFNFELRRNSVYLMKKEGKVFVCWEENCKSLSETVELKTINVGSLD